MPVRFSTVAEIYQGWYLDPADDCFKEWNGKMLLEYVKIARALPDIDSILMLGYHIKDTKKKLLEVIRA